MSGVAIRRVDSRTGAAYAFRDMVRRACILIRSLAIAVVASLVGAPLAGPLSLASRCVSACPMHAAHKPHCHEAAGPKGARPHAVGGGDCGGAAIAPPGCSCGHQLPTGFTPRAVLNVSAIAWAVPVRAANRSAIPWEQGRAADPPDLPPPILYV